MSGGYNPWDEFSSQGYKRHTVRPNPHYCSRTVGEVEMRKERESRYPCYGLLASKLRAAATRHIPFTPVEYWVLKWLEPRDRIDKTDIRLRLWDTLDGLPPEPVIDRLKGRKFIEEVFYWDRRWLKLTELGQKYLEPEMRGARAGGVEHRRRVHYCARRIRHELGCHTRTDFGRIKSSFPDVLCTPFLLPLNWDFDHDFGVEIVTDPVGHPERAREAFAINSWHGLMTVFPVWSERDEQAIIKAVGKKNWLDHDKIFGKIGFELGHIFKAIKRKYDPNKFLVWRVMREGPWWHYILAEQKRFNKILFREGIDELMKSGHRIFQHHGYLSARAGHGPETSLCRIDAIDGVTRNWLARRGVKIER